MKMHPLDNVYWIANFEQNYFHLKFVVA